MDRYSARMNLHGSAQRERDLNRLKSDITRKAPSSLSYKDVKLNGKPTQLMINIGTKPYYKEFNSLPEQKILAGDYVEWAGHTWIVYNADCDDEIYVDGNLRQCQLEIFWQRSDGTIISRFAYTENASAYNNGENGNNTITLQSNQFMVYLPYDEDTCELDNGKRVHMSRSNRKCKPYDLTRPDDITYGFGEKGILNIIFTQTQYDQDKDKLVTLGDGTQVWICDYIDISSSTQTQPSTQDETTDLTIVILGNQNLRIGTTRTYTANITDLDGNSVQWDNTFSWNVVSDIDVSQMIDENTIKLFIEDEDYVNSLILLQIIKDGQILTEFEITVIDSF